MKNIVPEPITTKQLEILLLLYRFRFLNRIQIQHFLNHKSDTRITSWLKDLTDRKIINRIYSQTINEINKPAVYYLGLNSRHILLQDKRCNPKLLKRVYREKGSSPGFQEHWQFMADLYFYFHAVSKEQNAELHFLSTTDLVDYSYLPLPLPDAYIAVKDKDQTKRYFLELIDGTDKWFTVDTRVKQYNSYFKKQYWQSHVDYPFPKILFILPHGKLKTHLQKFIKDQLKYERIDIHFFLGIKGDIQQKGIQVNTWEAA